MFDDLRMLPMSGSFTLGVDLDGVVADHTRRFRDILAEIRGIDPETLPLDRSWDFGEWGLGPGEYAELHRVAVMEYDMFRTMEVIDGAADALWRLSDAGVWIRIITHRLYVNWGHEKAVGDTAAWLDANRIPYRDLCFLGAQSPRPTPTPTSTTRRTTSSSSVRSATPRSCSTSPTTDRWPGHGRRRGPRSRRSSAIS